MCHVYDRYDNDAVFFFIQKILGLNAPVYGFSSNFIRFIFLFIGLFCGHFFFQPLFLLHQFILVFTFFSLHFIRLHMKYVESYITFVRSKCNANVQTKISDEKNNIVLKCDRLQHFFEAIRLN